MKSYFILFLTMIAVTPADSAQQAAIRCNSGGTQPTAQACQQQDAQRAQQQRQQQDAQRAQQQRQQQDAQRAQQQRQQQDAQRAQQMQSTNQPSQCWVLPTGGTIPATANSTPPISGARLGPCGTPQLSAANASRPVQQSPSPTSNTERKVVKDILGTGKNSDNCVFFARDKVPSLPTGLDTWQGKLNAINSRTPHVGSIAMIGFSTGAYKDIGHSAVVESISNNSITVIEANYTPGKITRRTATGSDLADAARQLGIAGYYRP